MNFLQKHLEDTSADQLLPEEKDRMRTVLLEVMEHTPVPSPFFGIPSPFGYARAHWPELVRVSSTVVAGILLVSTTAYAAQGALPGDLLYPIKTKVNEKVEGVIAVSDESKAALSVHLAEERIREAEQLIVANRLSTSTADQIETDFDEHTTQASAYTKRVSKEHPEQADEISTQFSESLSDHSDLLDTLSTLHKNASTSEGERSKDLSQHVRASAEKIKKDIGVGRAHN